jgi:predicted ATPase
MTDPAFLLQAHIVLGTTLFFLGEFVPARTHLENGIALYDRPKHHSLAFLYYGLDPGVFCLSWLALTLWKLGHSDKALRRSLEESILAQELSHPFSSAFALNWAGWLHQLCREKGTVYERGGEAIRLSVEQGFPFYLAWGNTIQGWALAEQGQPSVGIAQIQQGLDGMQTTGAVLWRPYHLALLAETYEKTRQMEEGLAAVAEALDIGQRTGTRFVEAELYRLKGELTFQSQVESHKSKVPNTQHLTPTTQAEAEACFLKAIEVAQKQQAKSLELRAVMSLARLWQQQALEQGARSTEQGEKSQESGVRSQEQEARTRLAEAHKMLSEVYNWFTEGFDTKDLREAKALLAELA